MFRKWSAAGVAFVVALLLAVPTWPAGATETWDLTAGPVVVSYTLDLTDAPDIFLTNNWSQQGAVGLFSGTAGARMVGFLYDWDKNDPSKVEPTLDNDDKFNMQEPVANRWGEGAYDIANCNTGIVGPAIGSGSNYGIWFDRDGVDQWQAAMFGMIDGATYNTGGVYDVELTFRQAATPGYGFVCATVNGIPTGFYTSWVSTGPQITPAGISFGATPEQLRTMELVTSTVPGIVISDVEVDGVASYTTAADCETDESFVPSKGGTVSLPVVAGHKYEIDARGTYYAGGTSQFDIRADAQYSQDAIQRAANPGADWTDLVNGYGSYGSVLLELTVDGAEVDWGSYTSTHAYSLTKVAGTTALTFAFDVNDIYADNNTGGLCVSLTDLGNVGTFSGFFQPIDNNVPNSAKAGQVIPIKWRLLDYNGVPVSDPNSFKSVTSVSGAGACAGLPTDAIEEYVASSGLQYLGDGYWQFNWKTPKAYAGQCRTMTLTLSDLSEHTASFTFK